jgi:hypothetical protein
VQMVKLTRLVAVVALSAGTTAAALPAAAAPPAAGTFSVLSYNVAGLPEGLSSGNPKANTPIIGQRIRPYDIVHVQEDFNFHASLYANNTHPFRTPTSGGVPFGDGLNTLANHPYSDLVRDKWDKCNGTDCLTPKGFTWSRTRVAEGVLIDFYNVHANAGSNEADLAARRANISELSRFIAANSAGNAVIVAGDTNTRYTRTGDNIRELVSANGLTDAWVQEEHGGVPPAAGSPTLGCNDAAITDACEVVDKILFRGNRYITLNLTRYANENDAVRPLPDRGGLPVDAEPGPVAQRFLGRTARQRVHRRRHGSVGAARHEGLAARRFAGRPGRAHPRRRHVVHPRRQRRHGAGTDVGSGRAPHVRDAALGPAQRSHQNLLRPLHDEHGPNAVRWVRDAERRHVHRTGGLADRGLPRPFR